MAKLLSGVVEVITDRGPFYVPLTFSQRLYLVWTFRNFRSLPLHVLSRRAQNLVMRLCTEVHPQGMCPDAEEVIGSVEWRLAAKHQPVTTVPSARTASVRHTA